MCYGQNYYACSTDEILLQDVARNSKAFRIPTKCFMDIDSELCVHVIYIYIIIYTEQLTYLATYSLSIFNELILRVWELLIPLIYNL